MRKLLVLGLVLASVNGFGFGLSSVTDKKESSKKVDTASIEGGQKKAATAYMSAIGDINLAQQHLLVALGLKDKADALKKEAASYGKGNVDKEKISKRTELTEETNKAIKEKMKEKAPLSAESKKEFVIALPLLASGTSQTAKLIPTVVELGKGAADAVSSAGLSGAMAAKDKVGMAISLASIVPGAMKDCLSTTKMAMDFAKSNNIDVSNASAKLGAL